MTVIHLHNKLNEAEIRAKEIEFDMRLRTLLLEMQGTFHMTMGKCLAASLMRLTDNEVFELDKDE